VDKQTTTPLRCTVGVEFTCHSVGQCIECVIGNSLKLIWIFWAFDWLSIENDDLIHNDMFQVPTINTFCITLEKLKLM